MTKVGLRITSDAPRCLPIAFAVGALLSFGCSSGGGGAQPSDARADADAADAGIGGAAASGAGGRPASGTGGAGGKLGAGGMGAGGMIGAGGAGAGGNAGVGGAGAGGNAGVGGAGTGGMGTGGAGTGGAGAGGAGTGGAGAGGTGGGSNGGFFEDLASQSSGMTVAVDSSGVINVATAVSAQSGYLVSYGRCAGQCDLAPSWSGVVLPFDSDTSHVPSVALTANGRPRILYASFTGGSPGYHYLECDSACDQAASWQDVRLTSGAPLPTIVPGPRAPFAVSPSGRAAFLTDNGGNELDIWFCGSSCGLGSSWTRVPLASTYVYAEGVAFGPDDSLQLIARHTVRNQESVVWYDCSGDCSSAASWAGLDNLWVAQGQFQAQVRGVLARTAQGGTRILFSSGDLVAPADQRVFGYLACDSSCRSAQSWKQPLQAPISGAAATVGFGFALDRAGQPAVATLNDFGAAFWRCTGDCTSVGAQWSAAPVVTVSDLNSFLPPTVPAGCLSASWGMYVGPDLAFDPVGKPVITLTANVKALGGDCGTGSAAITTDSFIYSNSL